MNMIVRCPHCSKATNVETADDWQVGETLATVCTHCDDLFSILRERSGHKIIADIQLPSPVKSKLKSFQKR